MAFSLGHRKLVLSAVIILLVFYMFISYTDPVKVMTNIYKTDESPRLSLLKSTQQISMLKEDISKTYLSAANSTANLQHQSINQSLEQNQTDDDRAETWRNNQTDDGRAETWRNNQTDDGRAETWRNNQTDDDRAETWRNNQTDDERAETWRNNQTDDERAETWRNNQTDDERAETWSSTTLRASTASSASSQPLLFSSSSCPLTEDLDMWFMAMPPRPYNSCTCVDHSTFFEHRFPTDEYKELKSRRAKEFQKHKARTQSVLSKLLFAAPNSPLHYPIQGFTVRPLTPTVIPGLQLHAEERKSYRVTLKVTKGVLTTKAPPEHVNVVGTGTNELIIESNNKHNFSYLLTTVTYTSTIYHVNTGDLVLFTFENHEAVFPITIREPPVPVLYDMGHDINSQVTIITKTFLRYSKLRVLLSSIRKFYSKITIIIADDSLEPQKVTGENIQHYIMPPAQGWFAGRNLAVSQVTTKYFLWVDDDFEFTENTKIEKMVEVMEAVPDLDVLGGAMKGSRLSFTVLYEEGNEIEGGCLYRKSAGRFQPLPGHPGCFHVSGVLNFFLARTDAVEKVRFDPKLQRVAHSEFFIDGFGSLMVASCTHVTISHQPRGGNTASYGRFRHPGKKDEMMKERLHFFKNNLRCIRYG
ncbi:beta-1,4 N-acetylgalactosaminyltransferase 2-like [Cheilinus undulatus]|uniref:beta-1,4 N-acetylgalactosaminyltransferase 2-like n=1 Tax=Cheilinus undulatus TaxID=241271 RepID=UPI001BD4C219|nr:beta-1,4 N-acetylgalactosaminyltransferase 2-like [Cheilinus undulatus]